ncbi:MAG: dehydrogenase [Elusimicrobia bacterium]|nr:MAG: dehydrogenase [Elusimicrobiota bacterium]KAF0158193.1 MAG: dehydrogenase [Elusimicrobiota bacterium]
MQRTVLVTGASAGIGCAAAELFLKKGYKVYAGARRSEKMAPLRDKGAEIFPLDVADEASLRAAASRVLDKEGSLDILVNNAGYGAHGAIEDVPLDEARRQFEVNVFAPARLAQLFLPSMRERRSGRIINISSIAGRISLPAAGWYHASKYALEAWSDALRIEVKPFGVKVVLIEPGPIRTEWDDTALVNLKKYSGSGSYAPLVERLTGRFRSGYREGAPGPEAVAAAILKGAEAGSPAPRYIVPFKAALMVSALRLLPDRLSDFLLDRLLNPRQ